MPTVRETAYPQLKRHSSNQELSAIYSPSPDEMAISQRQTRNLATQLGFLVQLKTFQRLGYVINIRDVPAQIKEHIAQMSNLKEHLMSLEHYDQSRTRQRHLSVIREYFQIHIFDAEASKLTKEAMTEASQTKHDLADLINRAIEVLVEQRYELPVFSRLQKMARHVRSEATEQLYQLVSSKLNKMERLQLNRLFLQDSSNETSQWNRLKQEPGKPLISRLQEWIEHLEWLSLLQIDPRILSQIPHVKVQHFGAEAMTLDAARMRELKAHKRDTLAICLLSMQYAQTLDDIVEFFIKRIRQLHYKGQIALEEYRKKTQGKTDDLISTLHELVVAFQSDGEEVHRFKAMEQVIGDCPQQILEDCEAHLAYTRNNYFPFLVQFYRSHRPVLFRMLEVLPLCSSTQDSNLKQAIEFIKANRMTRQQWLSISEADKAQENPDDKAPKLDLSWLPSKWWSLVTGQCSRQSIPTQIHRTYFELCVFSHLSLGLQAGDLYIPGSDQYDDYYSQLISWEEYEATVEEFGKLLNIPVKGEGFVAQLKQQLQKVSKTVDEAFPSNTHISFEKNRLVLHKKNRKIPEGLKELAALVSQRIRPVNLLDLLDDTQRWLDWTRFFGPISGHDAKVANSTHRYLMATFCYGCNIGASQLARALSDLDRRQLSWIHHRHIQEQGLQRAIEDTINFYNRFTLPQYWGTGKHASVDGTKWDIYDQNLLAEYHIRYGGYGGIGYYHVSDNYIALFSHFIPCGVWEAIYILDGLFKNQSDIQPDTIHGDTQAQSVTVFALAHLLGIKLMPRIRGWQDLTFYRPTRNTRFKHLNALFTEVAPWDLIETHLPDMLRVALSIKAGKIQASTILRKLGTNSPNNKLFQAFQALGGIIRTIFLLQYLDDADLRNMVQACTNKSESFNRLAKWLSFGGEQQVLTSNNRDELRKRIKYNHLVANCLILYNVSEISRILNELAGQGYRFSADAIARLSPYLTEHINRFGAYGIDSNRDALPLDFDLDISILLEQETLCNDASNECVAQM
jgi:TnpA family transposase